MTATRDTIILVLVLALDTTTRAGSVAVTRDDTLLALVEGDASVTHGERLPAELATALERAHATVGDVDLLVVATGPGAFTGLRIGLAAIQGLAMVSGKPVVGVSAFDALAHTARAELGVTEPLVIWLDAQRGEVFGACYADEEIVGEPVVGLAAALLEAVPFRDGRSVTFIGDGARKYASLIRTSRIRGRVVEQFPALAPALARVGWRRASQGAAGPPHALRPLYVRRPDAELDRERLGKYE